MNGLLEDDYEMLGDYHYFSPGGLDTEIIIHISNGKPLAINGAEADPPLSGVTPGQLGDVVGRLPGCVGETSEIQIHHMGVKGGDMFYKEG